MEKSPSKKRLLVAIIVAGIVLIGGAFAALNYTKPIVPEDRYMDHAPPPGPNARPDPPNPAKQKRLKAAAPAG